MNDIRATQKKRTCFYCYKKSKSALFWKGVGAGTGTRAFGFKGGIGTSSRVLPPEAGGYTVGVLVQTNFGGPYDKWRTSWA
ncbi:MAG: hypothetical protein Ct9H300mP29_4650 [Candidatus Neomarinimicrobiota bacterium]|nr:MAG: hypothetical protein Ct9H300mP29_4650 [Candidatus Neomarinimicrobiota bacterium]